LKTRRLRAQAQFQSLRDSPPAARTAHFVLHRAQSLPEAVFPTGGSANVWLGAAVPKRWAKRAVTRNLIKRQIFNVGEQHLMTANASVTDAAYLVRLRAGYAREQFRSAASDALRQAVRTELTSLFSKALKS
jgi:ribonuclease P protein component